MELKPYKDLEIGTDYVLCAWEDIGKGDECAPHYVLPYRHTTIGAVGDLGPATLALCGSMDGKQFDVLAYAEGIKSSDADVVHVKPALIGGDEFTKITIIAIFRR